MLPILSLCRFEDFKNLYICLQIAIKEKGVCKLQLKIRGYAGAWSIFEFQTLNIYQNLCIKWTASLILSDLPCKDMALLDLQQYYLNKIWRKKAQFSDLKSFYWWTFSLLLLYPTSHFCRETTNEIKRTVLNKQKHSHI